MRCYRQNDRGIGERLGAASIIIIIIPLDPLLTIILTGLNSSKWLDFRGGGGGGSSWLEFRLLSGSPPAIVATYDLVSGNDCPERDPCDWVLEGMTAQGDPGVAALRGPSPDGASPLAPPGKGGDAVGETEEAPWTVLDQRRGVVFAQRRELRTFAVAPALWLPCR